MTTAKPTTNPEKDLAIREMILGVLQGKDSTGRNIIHSSDFRTSITDLGFPMGSTVIENILVHCKIDSRGNLDFTELEKELIRERRVFNTQRKVNTKPPVSTSSGVMSKPWRGDEFHQAKVAAEKQLKKITEHNPVVHNIYSELSHHQLGPQDAIRRLEMLEIYPTKEFIKVLQLITFNDVSFSQFVKALTISDPNAQDLDDLGASAGSMKVKPADTTDIIGLQRKRSTNGMKSAFQESGDFEVKQKPIRKMVNDGPVNDQTIFKAEQIKRTLFCDSRPVSLLSHNQENMVTGSSGTKDIDVSFNVEAKVQREQVLAALRKLDVGAISMDDFQDMLFSLGVDLPEVLAVDIRQSVVSGKMDVKRYVKLLDASIFKHAAIEERVTKQEVKKIKDNFTTALLSQKLDALLDLSQIFRDMDKDGDGNLTFSEFRNGCQLLSLPLNENDLRMLFHSFDNNGDGTLQYEEFLSAIRGEFSAVRASWTRRAFQKLDRHGEGCITVDILSAAFNPEAHPFVSSGLKSCREVSSEFVRWFTNEPNFDGTAKYDRFEQYFANIGANITSDDEFIRMMKNCLQLSDLLPPPPVYKLRHKIGGGDETPAAIQSHGDYITWNQEHSMLEQQALDDNGNRGKKKIQSVIHRNAHSDVIRWHNHGAGSSGANAAADELKEMGVLRLASGRKNDSNKSLLAWCVDSPARSKNEVIMSPKSESISKPKFILQYQDEQPMAGVPAFGKVDKGTPNKSLEGYRMNIPYGVDTTQQNSTDIASPSIKSLADIMREKQTAKPLVNYAK